MIELLTEEESRRLLNPKNILVTGGEGFIGSNFIKYLMGNSHAPDLIVNYDKKTYAGQGRNLEEVSRDWKNYVSVLGDICDEEKVMRVMREYGITHVVNFAAESHVDRSLADKEGLFWRTNVLGAETLMECALKNDIIKFVQISTDEVYGSLTKENNKSTERSLTDPRNPYSITKRTVDLRALNDFSINGLNISITRSSNNYGPHQYPEKLIPLALTNLIEGKKVPIYGAGRNIRDWLHVEDNCKAINLVMEKGKSGEIYNIAGDNEWENIELIRYILKETGFSEDRIEFVTDRENHDFRYAMSSEKIHRELGWQPLIRFEGGIEDTILWYENNRNWWEGLKNGEKQKN